MKKEHSKQQLHVKANLIAAQKEKLLKQIHSIIQRNNRIITTKTVSLTMDWI